MLIRIIINETYSGRLRDVRSCFVTGRIVSMRQFHRHLKILTLIIVGCLAAVLANGNNDDDDRLY